MAIIEVRPTSGPVVAKVSDRIVIRIPENATTGYQWSVRELHGPVEVESSGMAVPEPLTPGAAGERVVVVRPTGAGRAHISLELKRRWEPDPVDRFDLEIEIG